MNQVKAKFVCTEVRSTQHGDTVTMTPVVSGSKENAEFYKHTPGGQVSLSTVNPALKGFFAPGVEYMLTFEVPVPDVASHQHAGSPYDGSQAPRLVPGVDFRHGSPYQTEAKGDAPLESVHKVGGADYRPGSGSRDSGQP